VNRKVNDLKELLPFPRAISFLFFLSPCFIEHQFIPNHPPLNRPPNWARIAESKPQQQSNHWSINPWTQQSNWCSKLISIILRGLNIIFKLSLSWLQLQPLMLSI